MQFTTKLSVAILAALAVGGEANHQALHARQFFRDHHGDHHKDVDHTRSVSSVFVYPTPLQSSVAAASSSVAVSSSVVAASSSVVTPAPIPLSTGVPGSSYAASAVGTQTAGEASEITLTYTLGNGTSKTVVTTTIHRTSTDYHTVYVTPESSPLSTPTSTISLVNVPTPGADNAQACSQDTVTVTATATVTVTATPTPTSPVQEVGSIGNNGDKDQDHKKPHKPEGDHGKDHDKDGKQPQFTPPPYGNGTAPFSSGVAKPTGFVTSRLPFPTGFRHH